MAFMANDFSVLGIVMYSGSAGPSAPIIYDKN